MSFLTLVAFFFIGLLIKVRCRLPASLAVFEMRHHYLLCLIEDVIRCKNRRAFAVGVVVWLLQVQVSISGNRERDKLVLSALVGALTIGVFVFPVIVAFNSLRSRRFVKRLRIVRY